MTVDSQITFEYEITLVTNKILKLESMKARDVLAAHKETQKGKRMMVKGQHHITIKPILKNLSILRMRSRKEGGLGSRTTKRRSFQML